MDNIPLPIAIALIVTTTGCIYFFVQSWLAAKERDQNALDTRFDDVYNHINKVEESLDRRISDENAAMWRNIDDINDRIARKSK
jgi:acyl carrier protein